MRSSSWEIVFLRGCRLVRLSSYEIILTWGISCTALFLWGCLPVRLSSCKVFFLWCCLPFQINLSFFHKKTFLQEDDFRGRWPHRKTTSREDKLTGRWPHGKTTSPEDHNNISLAMSITELGPAQSSLFWFVGSNAVKLGILVTRKYSNSQKW